MKKRGFSTSSETVLYVLALVVIVAVTLLMPGYSEGVKAAADRQECLESVKQNALAHIRGLTIPTVIDCPTDDIEIESKNPEVIKEGFARAMYECWWRFGEGKYNLFSRDITYCNVCALIDFEANAPVRGLMPYLAEEDIPDESGRSYLDYLMGYQTPNSESVLGEGAGSDLVQAMQDAEDKALDPTKTYAVIFVYSKGKDNLRKVFNHISLSSPDAKISFTASVAAGGAAAAVTYSGFTALAAIGVATGPVGWIVLATGAIVAATVHTIGFIMSEDNWPEWSSFVVLREWEAQHLIDLGCQEIA